MIGWIEQNMNVNSEKKEIKMNINPICMSFTELNKKKKINTKLIAN